MLVGLAVDEFGFKDKGINEKALKGLNDLKVDTQVDVKSISSNSKNEYFDSIESLVDSGAKLIWASGFQMAQDLREVSKEYPDVHFASLDNPFDDSTMANNLTGTIFKTEEASYLLGYIAGYTTKTNKVGFLGGDKGVLVDKNEFGFRSGVLDAAKERKAKIDVVVKYLGTFSDKEKGKNHAKTLFDTGIDIIYTNAGLGDLGAVNAARDSKKFLMVTEPGLFESYKDVVLLSVEKNYSEVLNTLSSRFLAKEEIGGKNFEFGLKHKALSISDFDPEGHITKAIYEKAKLKQAEIASEKKVPAYDEASFKKFSQAKK